VSRPQVPGRAVRIGLTGPIGCGKSTVAAWLGARGAAVIDADDEARAATGPGGAALEAVIWRFGEAFRGADGGLDRAALARVVFDDPAALADLEAIVHPVVRRRILAGLASADSAGRPAVAVEAIKLIEGGLAELCDEVWLVDCRPAEQRARLAARGLGPAEAERRMAAQAGLRRRARAIPGLVRIDASGDPAATERRVAAAFARALAAAPPSEG